MANLLETNQAPFFDFVQRSLASCRAIAFVSFEKSSGKSTAFRAFLHTAEGISCGITSIGADDAAVKEPTAGEHLHYVKPGTIIATARQCLPFCEPTRTILADTSVHTPLGEVIIFRAESPGRVFLAGPSIIADAIKMKNTLIDLGAECVLMDGAGARTSPANPLLADGVVLCSNLTSDVAQTIEDLQYQVNLLQTKPIIDERLREICRRERSSAFPFIMIDQNYDTHLPGNGETINQLVETIKQQEQTIRAIYFSGALTDRQAAILIKLSKVVPELLDKSIVIVDDPTKLLLSKRPLAEIQASPLSLGVLRPLHLLGIALNPIGADKEAHRLPSLFRKMTTACHLPVFDVHGGTFFEIPD